MAKKITNFWQITRKFKISILTTPVGVIQSGLMIIK
jgi:hypothetical protein